MIAEHLIRRQPYAVLTDEPCHCGESIAATVQALWRARAEAGSGDPLAALQHVILNALADVSQPGWCVNLRGLQGRTGLPREVLRGLVANLRDRGLASYHKGLWTDDGEPGGAGYAITNAGLASIAKKAAG